MSEAGDRKTIFITGAASGIGAETARYFSERGWYCGLYDVDGPGLEKVAQQIGAGNCTYAPLDVRDRDDWANAVDGFAEATGGRMNVLFNNAGVGRHGWFDDIASQDDDWVIDVNLKGVVNGVKACLPLLRAHPPSRIVNTASTAGLIGSPQLSVYSATKFAVRGLTESLNAEFHNLGVRVTSLMPWFIDTPILEIGNQEGANRTMADQIKEQGQTVYPVSLAAKRAWDAAHGDKMHYTVGGDAARARWMMRFLPGRVRKAIIQNLPPRG